MNQDTIELEDELKRATKGIKTTKWLSVISVAIWVLFPIALLSWLICVLKLSSLKKSPVISETLKNLNDKTTKELKSIQRRSEPLEQLAAGLIIAHKSAIITIIVVGMCLVIFITAIFLGR